MKLLKMLSPIKASVISVFVFAVAPVLTVNATLPATNTSWCAVNGDYNGAFNDPAHWSPYALGLPFLQASFNCTADYTVTFPAGRTEVPSAFWVYAKADHVTTLTGPDSVWVGPDCEVSSYPQRNAIELYANGKVLFSSGFVCGSDGLLGWGTISNFTLRVSATNDDYRAEFVKGSFDFDHVGERKISGSQVLFNNASLDKPSYIIVGPEAEWIGHSMYLQLCAPTNVLRVDGGSFTLANTLQFPCPTWEFCSAKATTGLIDVRNGGSFAIDALYMGGNGTKGVSDLKTMSVVVTGDSTFESRNLNMNGPGRMTFDVTGSTFCVTNMASFANVAGSTNVFRAVDAEVSLKGLTVGGTTAATAPLTFARMDFNNTALELVTGPYVYNGELNFGEGTVVTLTAGEIKGYAAYGGHSKLTFDGATLVPTAQNTASGHLQALDEVQVGAKGLTVSPRNNVYTTLKVNFSNKPGEEGQLILPNAASYKLNGTGTSTESELVCGGGSGVYLCDGNHHSKVVVTNGTVFSLSYLPSDRLTAEVAGLQLGDGATFGRLGLNANQTLISDTEPQFGQYEIAYPANKLVAGVYTTIVAKVSSVSIATRIAWEDGLQLQNGTVSGRYYVGEVVEDGERTYFTIRSLDARPEREGTTAWQGASDADWDDPQNWADGKKPSETYGAVFEPAGATTVNLGSVTAASIDFGGADTTLKGAQIRLSDTAGIALNATAGENRIEVGTLRLPKGQTPAAIAEGASIEVTGDVIGSGGIQKTGAGKLVLSGESTALPSGFSHEGGILQIDDAAVLSTVRSDAAATIRADTLRLGEEGAEPVTVTRPLSFKNNSGVSGKGVVLRVDSDVTMPYPSDNANVSVLKRGPGTLTWNFTGANVTMNFTLYNQTGIGNPTSGIVEPVVFDDETGATPLCRYGTWNVCEGEMCWRGLDATPTVVNPNNVGVAGLATATASSEPFAQPVFRLDNVQIDNRDLWFMFAAGLKADDGGLVTDPKLFLENNAAVRATTIAIGDTSTNALAHPFLSVDGSELYAKKYFYPNKGVQGQTSRMLVTGVFTNGASCFASATTLQNNSDYAFFGSTFAGIDGGYTWLYQDNDAVRTNRFAFSEGSLFACTNIRYTVVAYANNAVVRLDFDDAEWDAGDADVDLTVQQVRALVGTTGKGVAFAPPAGRTWRFATPISGTGDFVKRGAGTFAFDTFEHYDNSKKKIEKQSDPVTMNWTGTTRVEAGALTFPVAACREGMAFDVAAGATLDLGGQEHAGYVLSGAGTVSDGTLTGCTLALSIADGAVVAAPCFDNVTFAGRTVVDFGRTAENPLADPTEGLVVARWTGTRPDVSRWRATGTGLEGSVKGFFTANDDGTVSARVQTVGLLLLVR